MRVLRDGAEGKRIFVVDKNSHAGLDFASSQKKRHIDATILTCSKKWINGAEFQLSAHVGYKWEGKMEGIIIVCGQG